MVTFLKESNVGFIFLKDLFMRHKEWTNTVFFFFFKVFLTGIKSIQLKGQLSRTIQNLELSRDTQHYLHCLTQ